MSDEKKTYKIVYERPACIGAAACAAVYPEKWVMSSEDGKANLVGSVKKEDNGDETWELEFTQEEFEQYLNSAQVCPVTVIHIYDETGKQYV